MNELSKNLYCVLMRNGIEMWIEHDRVRPFQDLLIGSKDHRFVHFDDQTINLADVTGVFSAVAMEEMTRRKNGQWKCRRDVWHDRKQECECRSTEYASTISVEEISEKQRQKNVAALKEIRAKYVNAGMFKMS